MNTDFMFFIRAGGISKALYPCESVSIRGSTESLRMKLFSLAKIFAVLPLFGACLASGANAAPAKPNIVFILADDLGWKDVGYMGSTFYRTPNIDRLAREGMQFTKAYSAACLCSPSRGALYSGKNPARTAFTTVFDGPGGPDDRLFERSKDRGGVNQNLEALHRHALSHSETTFAQVLGTAGYATGFFGKWHCGEVPGYEPEDFGFQVARGYRLPRAGGNTRGHWANSYPSNTLANLPALKPDDYLSDVLTDETIRFIHDKKSRPFLVVLSQYLVHLPLQAKPELMAGYANAKTSDQTNSKYAAMIESLDQSVGRVMRALHEEGLEDNTLLIFTSDNGGHLGPTSNYPLMGGKASPFEAGMRVPLAIRWPARVRPGSTCAERVIGMDFYPTFLAAAGLPLRPRQHMDGLSLLPLLTASGKLPDRPLVFHFPHYSGSASPNTVLLEHDWKLIRFYNDAAGRYLLFNLVKDPYELHDVSTGLPDKAGAMDERLTSLLAQMKAQLPLKNPAYDPTAKQLYNRQTTLASAEKLRREKEALLKASTDSIEVERRRQ
jgi:arylsulfatase A